MSCNTQFVSVYHMQQSIVIPRYRLYQHCHHKENHPSLVQWTLTSRDSMKIEKETEITLRSLQHLCHKFQNFHTVHDLTKTTKSRLLTKEMMNTIEQSLKSDDEMTARKLRTKLAEEFSNLPNVSATIKLCQKEIGWICTRPHYCQLKREANKKEKVV